MSLGKMNQEEDGGGRTIRDSQTITVHSPQTNFSSLNFDDNGSGKNAEACVKAGDKVDGEGASTDRALWSSKMQFMLSCVSMSVGLGNVWRFPYLMQKYGGGAFLIPYLAMMVIQGAPLFLIELGIGQRLRKGSLGVWNKVHPWTGGIGITATVTSFLVGLYYNVIVCWCFYYLFNSFQSSLPFGDCPTWPESNLTSPSSVSSASSSASTECQPDTAWYFFSQSQMASESIDELGGINWRMALCLLLAWLIVYVCIMKGIQSSGKVMYFTAIFPYIILVAFLCRALTLHGAGQGLLNMITPDMQALRSFECWMAAATQVFYSLGLGFGSLIAFASYNPVKNDCRFDSIFMCVITVATALLASVDVFAVMGHKAEVEQQICLQNVLCDIVSDKYAGICNLTIDEFRNFRETVHLDETTLKLDSIQKCTRSNQISQGPGLAFIAFTEAILLLPAPHLWSIAFFMMMVALGLGSQFGTMEGVITNLFDLRVKMRKEVLTGVLCGVSYLIGLIFTTRAGSYWVGLFDAYAGTFGLVIVGFCELVVITYVYGHKRFCDDIEFMTGWRPGIYWLVMWKFAAPLLIIVIVSGTLYRMISQPQTYDVWNEEKHELHPAEYPTSVMATTILMMVLTVVPVPLVFVVRRFGCTWLEPSMHEAALRRVDTTVSTAEMVVDVDSDLPQDDGICNSELHIVDDTLQNVPSISV